MSDKSSASSGGIGFCGLLTIVFIILKLTNNIDWAWGWVFAPLWMIPAIILAIYLIVVLAAVIANLFGSRSKTKKNKKWS